MKARESTRISLRGRRPVRVGRDSLPPASPRKSKHCHHANPCRGREVRAGRQEGGRTPRRERAMLLMRAPFFSPAPREELRSARRRGVERSAAGQLPRTPPRAHLSGMSYPADGCGPGLASSHPPPGGSFCLNARTPDRPRGPAEGGGGRARAAATPTAGALLWSTAASCPAARHPTRRARWWGRSPTGGIGHAGPVSPPQAPHTPCARAGAHALPLTRQHVLLAALLLVGLLGAVRHAGGQGQGDQGERQPGATRGHDWVLLLRERVGKKRGKPPTRTRKWR